jgi:hypothetical protein
MNAGDGEFVEWFNRSGSMASIDVHGSPAFRRFAAPAGDDGEGLASPFTFVFFVFFVAHSFGTPPRRLL